MRQFLYKKNGKLKRYYYCSHCPAGPFTDDDVLSGKVHAVGQRQPMHYCDTCYKELFSNAEKTQESYRVPKDMTFKADINE